MPKTDSRTLTEIAKYLNTPPQNRGALVRTMLNPGRGFDCWLPIKQAATKDRNTTRDGTPFTAAASQVRADLRGAASSFADAWIDTAVPRWAASTAVPIAPAVAEVGPLEVRVRPQFAEQRSDGLVEVGLVYCNKAPLSDFARNGTLRIIERAYPDAIAVLVDLPRAKLHSSEGKKLERFDSILNAEAAGLHYLLSPPDDVAA
ncbi:hypothetical protein [Cellulosimicrobium cellulans]|uniref:hypothetical protein n=1 Tax=Cellulosimicrobium cellulans TaxID=1710 RepID=UPI00030423EE|nr:hypothetical protein [Cellulosimicrobium cellulans]